MKKISSPIFPLLVIIFTISSCTKTNPVPDEHTQMIVLPANGAAVINANNQFAFDFFRATLTQDPENNNKLISPLSIYLALSMVYNGADNATKDSIAKTLELSGIDIASLNAVCHSLLSQFPQEDNKVRLSIANSIWYKQNSYQPFSAFLNTVQSNYDASVQPLNFDDHSSVNTINNWVAQKTNNKIPKILESISSNDLMYLINAIYFNGAWKYAFNTSDTYNDIFNLQDGSTKSVPFMKRQLKVNMFGDSSFTMIELPYGGGKSYSMYVLEPVHSQESISTFASSLNENVLNNAISKMDSSTIQLEIPKWEYSYELQDMKPELTMLGMGIAFSGNADFSKIYDPSQVQVYISKAIHKAYIKVNEEGTEAAAVTAIGITTTDMPMPPLVFKLDHPFVYSIVEKQTGDVLFLGIVNDPASN
ncbi:MAG TPA: serpin family protein [Hanamia sp.]